MFRSFLVLFFCVVLSACSSDDGSEALNEWFKDRGIANSYSLEQEDIYLSVKNSSRDADVSAFLVNTSAALGNANGIEQLLYFGLMVSEALSPVWILRTDTIFYQDFYGGKFPDAQKAINAEFCWLVENETPHDTTWLKFSVPFTDCKPIKKFEWKAGTSQDTFFVHLPDEFLALRSATADTLRLLAGIKLLTDDAILRIVPPTRATAIISGDISGLLRVAQITKISNECEQCLYAGVRESLSVVFEINKEDKIRIAGKPVVFAELVLPKSSEVTGSELGRPVPVVVSNNGNSEAYRVNALDVIEHGHPNLVFWKSDSLRLQVTTSIRNYVNAANLQEDTLEYTLRLGPPMLMPEFPSFSNSRNNRVFSDRSAFARYDFSSAFAEPVKLRLWFADFGDKK